MKRYTALLVAAAMALTLILSFSGTALAASASYTVFSSASTLGAQFHEQDEVAWQTIASEYTLPADAGSITSAQLLVNAYDVDLSRGEYDSIKITNTTTGAEQILGNLSGLDLEFNTTVFTVPASLLAAGNSYSISVDIAHENDSGNIEYMVNYWNVYIKSITLVLNPGAGANASVSLSPVANEPRKMDVSLRMSGLTQGSDYDVEYKLTNDDTGLQIGSATAAFTADAASTTKATQITNMTEDYSDDTVYTLDAIVYETPTSGTRAVFATASATLNGEPEINLYPIEITTSEGGQVNPTGTGYADENGDYTVSIYPASGMAIGDVKIDGVSVGAVSEYTFNTVTGAHKVEVTFIPLAEAPQTGSSGLYAIVGLALIIAGAALAIARRRIAG